MRRALGLVLAGILGIGVIAAIAISIRGRATDAAVHLTTVKGVIGSEKQPFFADPDVVKAFHSHGLDVKVDTAGSRSIATTFNLTGYDFAFPAGVPAAEKIRRDKKITTSYVPFYTPMAGGGFKPLAQFPGH